MQEMWVQSLSQEDALEEGMATHCSILAWRIPWTEEPGRLESMGSQRARHDWSNIACAQASTLCYSETIMKFAQGHVGKRWPSRYSNAICSETQPSFLTPVFFYLNIHDLLSSQQPEEDLICNSHFTMDEIVIKKVTHPRKPWTKSSIRYNSEIYTQVCFSLSTLSRSGFQQSI